VNERLEINLTISCGLYARNMKIFASADSQQLSEKELKRLVSD